MNLKIRTEVGTSSARAEIVDGEGQERRLAKGLALAATSLLAGCAVGPDYVEPETPPASFHLAEGELFDDRPFEAQWWAQFGDPVLDDLVERALRANLDVRTALLRIDESRALLRSTRRRQWPSSQYEAAREASKSQQPVFSTERIEVESYRAGFQSAWEIDVFGRLRRDTEAAIADAQAAEATLRDVQVLVAAEVVGTYLDLREAQKRLSVAEANLATQRETLHLTQVRYELGRGSELDVASARAALAATEAQIPVLTAQEHIAAHRLAVLVGARPGEIDVELAYREMPPHLTTLAIGSPEELLRRRPDIRAAERRLAAATARIGVAKADLFPRVSFDGFLGFIAGDSGELGESSSKAWSMTPVVRWAAFDLSGVRAEVRRAETSAELALAEYEATVLRALEETENAFVSYAQQRRRLEAILEQAEASRRAAELARIRYAEGALDFLRLLDAERTVLEAEDAAVVAAAELNAAVVAIYKALGGGWAAAPSLYAGS
ncbi:MAG: efflux transporter outer membrane subunit [Gammaproteobacteria bacterium]